jgi:uncharacterized protein
MLCSIKFNYGECKMKFEMYKDEKDEWRWRLLAGNARQIAESGEGYKNKKDCLHAITLVMDSQEAEVMEM